MYFNSKLEIKSYLKLIFVIIILLNFCLIKYFYELEIKHLIWWAPVLLLDIILHFYIFALLFIEWTSWDKRETTWRMEIAL